MLNASYWRITVNTTTKYFTPRLRNFLITLIIFSSIFLFPVYITYARMVCTTYNGTRTCESQISNTLRFKMLKCMNKGFSRGECIEEAKLKAFELSEKLEEVVTITFLEEE